MSFKNLNIKKEYRIPADNIINNFYIPLLNESILYQRSVAYFSSESLYEISFGIVNLLKNNGRIQLIVSPILSEEDIEAINRGYKKREEITNQSLLKYITEPKNYFEKQRLNILATLIATNRLDIKVAYSISSNQKFGLYHEKLGLMHDKEENIVAFSGSMNETDSAFSSNYEAVDVYTSWEENERVKIKEKAFNELWNNSDQNAHVFDFPEIAKSKLLSYKEENIDWDIDIKQFEEELSLSVLKNSLDITPEEEKLVTNIPQIPSNLPNGLYRYQIEAINNWKDQEYIGIFDMATGTGKTYTGLGAITQLYNDKVKEKNESLFVVICCPLQHLVTQWIEDIYKFNIRPIVAFGDNKYKDYKMKLEDAVFDYNLGVKKFVCLICVNNTFASDYVQNQLSQIKGNILLVVDEAHNFGTRKLLNTLDDKYAYRLALSATFERYGDEEGTSALYKYFKNKCIEFSLEDAIKGNFLTPYRYYPVIVTLTCEELEKYHYLSNEIGKCIIEENGTKKLSSKGEKLVLQRSRLVAGAYNKIGTLEGKIAKYKNDNHILVYCGATKVNEQDEDGSDLRQIDAISKILWNKYEMHTSQFTSKENTSARNTLKIKFAEGEDLQALIAIKCLDEGVNIPSIKTAFILASSRNPKEYIQRRGRVLRKFKGKNYAEIYDFITLPRKLDDAIGLTNDDLKYEKNLVKNELNRILEFKKISQNPIDSDELIEKIKDSYHLLDEDSDIIMMEDGSYE